MRIGIVGAGSIGSLLLGCLSKTSAELLVYGRGLHSAHLTASGLTLHIDGKDAVVCNPNDWEMLLEEQGLPEMARSSCDAIIMTGKASAFSEHLEVAKHLLCNNGLICTLSNGLGHEERLVQAFGAHRVLAATTTHGAYRPVPGQVKWAGIGEINIGPFVHSHTEDSVKTFLQFLADASLEPRWEDDGRVLLWNKMLLNIAINPIAGLLGKENGALLEMSIFESVVSVLLEGATIARAEGVRLDDDAILIDRLRNVLEKTSTNYCSMLQDIKAGRPTEIESLNAEICRRGEMFGIPTPLNELLSTIIQHL